MHRTCSERSVTGTRALARLQPVCVITCAQAQLLTVRLRSYVFTSFFRIQAGKERYRASGSATEQQANSVRNAIIYPHWDASRSGARAAVQWSGAYLVSQSLGRVGGGTNLFVPLNSPLALHNPHTRNVPLVSEFNIYMPRERQQHHIVSDAASYCV